MKRFTATLAFGILIGALTVGFLIRPAMARALSSPSNCGAWNVVPSPNPGSQNVLDGVAAISQSDIWAVGYSDNSTLTEHWDGANWNVVPSPNDGGTSYLYAVTAIATNNVWAVGSNGNNQTLTEHWDGSNWSVVPTLNQGTSSTFVAVAQIPGGSDVLAVGHYQDSNGIDQTLIEQWNGSNWNVNASPSPGPQGNDLLGVVALSANDAWAVGTAANNKGSYQTLTEHWSGSSWNVVSSPNVAKNGVFWGVAALPSSSNLWAVGTYGKGKSGLARTLTAQWNGTNWMRVNSPNIAQQNTTLFGVAADSVSDAWAVGLSYDNSGLNKALTEHWNGSNWKIVSSPNAQGDSILTGVTAVPASNILWAVGVSYDGQGNSQTVTESYCPKH